MLVALFAVSIALLSVASVEPGYATMRFRAVRVIMRHRAQIAMLGGALLASTAVLFLFVQFPS